MGAPNLLADNMEYGLSYSVVSYLKKLSQQVCCRAKTPESSRSHEMFGSDLFGRTPQTKIEYDRLIASIGKKTPPEAGIKVRWRGGGISLAQRRDFIQQLQSLTGDGPIVPMELNPKEFQGFHLALLNKVCWLWCKSDSSCLSFLSAVFPFYSIIILFLVILRVWSPRASGILMTSLAAICSTSSAEWGETCSTWAPALFEDKTQVVAFRCCSPVAVKSRKHPVALKCRVSSPDQLHSVPIAQMGNYQDFLKAAPQPLRDADPEQPKRLHTFGNPFKLDKKVRAATLNQHQPRETSKAK